MYCVVLAMGHGQSPDPVSSKGHCALADQGNLCGQRWLLVTSPQSKGPNKGQHTELVLAALYWLSRSNQLRGCVGCMCVLGCGIRTRAGSNFSCIKSVADSAEFKKGGSKNKRPEKRGKNKQRRKKRFCYYFFQTLQHRHLLGSQQQFHSMCSTWFAKLLY